MLDFETLGTNVNAPVVQIGACYFDRQTGEIGKTLKLNVSLSSMVKGGAKIDGETVEWWLKQSEAARKSITADPKENDLNAFILLNEFLGSAKNIWSHATFDFVILTETLRRLNIKPMFHYKAAKDIRTLTDLAKISLTDQNFIREGVHHDALEDCKFQVKYCVAAFQALRK